MSEWLSERRIHCPFCGETVSIIVDVSAGTQHYVEDCQVCCRPMEIRVAIDGEDLVGVWAGRDA